MRFRIEIGNWTSYLWTKKPKPFFYHRKGGPLLRITANGPNAFETWRIGRLVISREYSVKRGGD